MYKFDYENVKKEKANICVELKNCQSFAVCLHDKMINDIKWKLCCTDNVHGYQEGSIDTYIHTQLTNKQKKINISR